MKMESSLSQHHGKADMPWDARPNLVQLLMSFTACNDSQQVMFDLSSIFGCHPRHDSIIPSAEDWMQRRLKHSMPGLWGGKERSMEVENAQTMIDYRCVLFLFIFVGLIRSGGCGISQLLFISFGSFL